MRLKIVGGDHECARIANENAASLYHFKDAMLFMTGRGEFVFRLKSKLVSMVLVWPAFAFAQTTDVPEHDELTYVPQPQSATDYTNGSVRLGEIPGQDLIISLGSFGTKPVGDLKSRKPNNTTKSSLIPDLPHSVTTRQSVGLERDPNTGLPMDILGGASNVGPHR